MRNRKPFFPWRWSAVAVIALFMVAGLGGCGVGGGDGDNAEGLVRCQNCDDLQAWIVQTAIYKMNLEIKMNRDGGYYDDDDDWAGEDSSGGDDDDSAGDDDSGDDDDYVGDDDDGPTDESDNEHSDTNVQEKGVDEADIIKTDGDRLFVLAGGYLMLFDPDPADQTHEVSRIEVGGIPQEMFLYGDVALVFSTLTPYSLDEDAWPGINPNDLNYNLLKITLIDYTDGANPQLLREAYMEGRYLSSRRIDASARIVIFSEPNAPDYDTWLDTEEFCDWDTGECDEEAMQEAYDEMIEENQGIIAGRPLDEWLPRYHQIVYVNGEAQHSDPKFAECSDHYHPTRPRGYGFLTVMTVMMNDPQTKQPDVAIVAEGSTVYGSSQSLFIADDADTTWEWWGWDEEGDEEYPEAVSEIHMFDIESNPNQAVYKASGSVAGFVLNQFSMGEYQGNLRVATTSGWWEDDFTNSVYVLSPNGGNLNIIGKVGDIAPGEQIYAARFMGDKGYLITFFQSDPLFTFDLSDPTDPKAVGELEIYGFSNYLHPMDEDHLLAIGEPGDEWGSIGGVGLLVFDISDFANPKVDHAFSMGEYWGGYSEAQNNHKAFLYYHHEALDLDLLVIPIQKWGGYYDDDDDWIDDDDDNTDDDDDDISPEDFDISDQFSGFLVFNCNAQTGFDDQLFTVDHTGLEPESGSEYWWGMPWPLRSAVIGNYLYTLSDAALVISSLESYSSFEPIRLPYQDPWEGGYYDDDDDMEDGGGDAPAPDEAW